MAVNRFRVFHHPTRGNEAVKDGVSIPGFLFRFCWAFAKRRWVAGGLLFALTSVLVEDAMRVRERRLRPRSRAAAVPEAATPVLGQ